jgi:hypothetical protein
MLVDACHVFLCYSPQRVPRRRRDADLDGDNDEDDGMPMCCSPAVATLLLERAEQHEFRSRPSDRAVFYSGLSFPMVSSLNYIRRRLLPEDNNRLSDSIDTYRDDEKGSNCVLGHGGELSKCHTS